MEMEGLYDGIKEDEDAERNKELAPPSPARPGRDPAGRSPSIPVTVSISISIPVPIPVPVSIPIALPLTLPLAIPIPIPIPLPLSRPVALTVPIAIRHWAPRRRGIRLAARRHRRGRSP